MAFTTKLRAAEEKKPEHWVFKKNVLSIIFESTKRGQTSGNNGLHN
jgi:hypothetical protein